MAGGLGFSVEGLLIVVWGVLSQQFLPGHPGALLIDFGPVSDLLLFLLFKKQFSLLFLYVFLVFLLILQELLQSPSLSVH